MRHACLLATPIAHNLQRGGVIQNGTSKTKSEAQTLVNTEVTNAQNAWDALSDEEKARSSGRPGAITLP